MTFPALSVITRIRPYSLPTRRTSPFRKVPLRTNTVATTPRPRSSRASMTVPLAGPSTGALRSNNSACNSTDSNNASIPFPVSADISFTRMSPPHSSGTTSWAVSSCFTRSESPSSLSILFIATIRGTPAVRA